MDTGIPDGGLMRRVAQGDLDAFERLVLRHQEMVWRTAYRLVADHQAAEDIAQDAFLRVFEASERYRPTAAFRTYLHRIVVRLCLDYLRKGRPIATDHLLPADHGPTPELGAAHASGPKQCKRRSAGSPITSGRRSCCDTTRG
jgi:RNA polymerase sigma-70 factor (ECF subfamily)